MRSIGFRVSFVSFVRYTLNNCWCFYFQASLCSLPPSTSMERNLMGHKKVQYTFRYYLMKLMKFYLLLHLQKQENCLGKLHIWMTYLSCQIVSRRSLGLSVRWQPFQNWRWRMKKNFKQIPSDSFTSRKSSLTTKRYPGGFSTQCKAGLPVCLCFQISTGSFILFYTHNMDFKMWLLKEKWQLKKPSSSGFN